MKQYDDDLKIVLMYTCIDLRELAFYTPQDEPIIYQAKGDIVPQQFTSYETIRKAIYSLQDEGIIKVVSERILPASRHHDDYVWKVEIIRPELEKALEDFAKEYGVTLNVAKEQVRHEESIDWPEDFIWKDENTFDLGGKGEITFMPKANHKTKTYFKMMADAKGQWVEVGKMSSETGEDPKQVWIKLNQIKKDKIANRNLSQLLTVEARQDSPSAYRLVPYPKRNV